MHMENDMNTYPLLSDQQVEKASEDFKKDLIMGLSNQTSSLPMILNPISKIPAHPGNGVAVSIGGTNGYVSLFHISQSGVIKFLNREFFTLPTQTTKENLFELITKKVPAVSKGKKEVLPIGIGFAYPLKPILHAGFIDGILVEMSKGRTIKGLVGQKVRQEYHRYLIEKHNLDTTVTVANDAICLLLGGDGVEIAGVVGTGLNFAYWEKRSHIAPLKLSELPGFSQHEVAINIESANFDKIPPTSLLKIVDKQSNNPGDALSEKECAGAYLFELFNAGKDEIVGESCPKMNSTDELNEIVIGASEKIRSLSLEEKKRAKEFAENLFKRSAQITAIQISGILEKIGKTKGIVPIVMEGGIFWKAKNYSTLVNAYIHDVLPEVIPSFARLFGSSRRGIAVLARSPAAS